jgi:hypothetical protein
MGFLLHACILKEEEEEKRRTDFKYSVCRPSVGG